MSSPLFIILLAVTTMLFVYGISRVVFVGKGGQRKKLQERLGGDRTGYAPGALEHSILLGDRSTGLSSALASRTAFQSINRTLSQTFPKLSLVSFFTIVGMLALLSYIVAYTLFLSGLLAVIVGLVAGAIPFIILSNKRTARQRRYSEQLPEALDFLSRILRAGHSLSTGIQMMGTELPDPIASEYRRCYDQHSLGQPLEDSLKDMAQRIESTDFAFFVTAVLIQRQTGGDLSQVLTNISSMVRGRIRLQQYVKAKTAEGRFTGYILVAFPLFMFFVAYSMNPDYAGVLLHTSTGLKLLGTAIGLQVLGLFSIRWLTTVKV